MASSYSMDSREGAIRVGDWLVQCLKLKNPEASDDLFHKLLDVLKESNYLAQDTFEVFCGVASEVFGMLEVAARDGSLKCVRKSGPEEYPYVKSFPEVTREAEEFLRFLVRVAVDSDAQSRQDSNCSRVCDLLSQGKDFPELRLKSLMSLFSNAIELDDVRGPALVAILQYASDNNLFEPIAPALTQLVESVSQWDLQPEHERRLRLLIQKCLLRLGRRLEAYHHLFAVVTSLETEPESRLEEESTADLTAELAMTAVDLPEIIFFDMLLQLRAVQHLANTKHRYALELLTVLVTKTPDEVAKFYCDHQSLFEKFGVTLAKVLEKSRLLALGRLAEVGAPDEVQQVKLAAIGANLGTSEEEAETLVIRAIGQGHLDAKIDQLRQAVGVRSSLRVMFTPEDWGEMHTALTSWIVDGRELLGAIKGGKNFKDLSPLGNVADFD